MIYAGIALLIMLGTFGAISVMMDIAEKIIIGREKAKIEKEREKSERYDRIAKFQRQADWHWKEYWLSQLKNNRVIITRGREIE